MELKKIFVDRAVDRIRCRYEDSFKKGDSDKALLVLTHPDMLLTLTNTKPSTSFVFRERRENASQHAFDFESLDNLTYMLDNGFENEFGYVKEDISEIHVGNEKNIMLFIYNKNLVSSLLEENIDMFSNDDRLLIGKDNKKLLSRMVKQGDYRMGIVYGFSRGDVEKFRELEKLINKIPNFKSIIGDNPSEEMMNDKGYLQVLSDYYSKEELSEMRYLFENREFARIFLKHNSDVEGYLHSTWDVDKSFNVVQYCNEIYNYAKDRLFDVIKKGTKNE